MVNELHGLIKRKFKKLKVYSCYQDKIWGADVADIQLISTYNKGDRFLLCVTDIYSKYTWIIPLKDYNYQSIQKKLDESGPKFYNRSTKSWLYDNYVEIYSARNKGKSVLLKDLS